ncbi:DUF4142 domain-containing protein [Pararhizobium sp. O133]|uniref:DUF4142 domain-containing protein n=1 Tax=Pararhizobium sp. O133 TaxID=3449278 RepID=UPI003F689737
MPKTVIGLFLALIFASSQSTAVAQQSPSSEDFAREAAISNEFELQAAQLAVKRGKDPRAITFANDMLRDHGNASAGLAEAAKKDGIRLSTALDDRRKKTIRLPAIGDRNGL